MLTADLIASQRRFVAKVVSLAPGEEHADLDRAMVSPWRISVYRESFIGRTISALVDAVLEPAVKVFGGDCVKEVTARYFAHNPPSARSIEDTLAGLPTFITDHSQDHLALMLASLVEASIAYWGLLVGVDKLDRAIVRGLAYPCALVKASGAFDLFMLFESASGDAATSLEDPYAAHGETVDLLFIKTHVDTIISVPSPRNLSDLVLSLISGKDFNSAIADLSPEAAAVISAENLQSFIQCLQSYRAIVL